MYVNPRVPNVRITGDIRQTQVTNEGKTIEGVGRASATEPRAKMVQQHIIQHFSKALGEETEIRYMPQEPSVIPPETRSLKDLLPDYNSKVFVMNMVNKESGKPTGAAVVTDDLYVTSKYVRKMPTKSFENIAPTTPEGQLLNTAVNAQRLISAAEKDLGMDLKWNLIGPQRLIIGIDEDSSYYEPTQVGAFGLLRFARVNINRKHANNPDVVTHEVGHAIVDKLRPDWMNAIHPESKALHEGLADVQASLISATDPKVIQATLDEKGNIKRGNPISYIGENAGTQAPKGSIRVIEDERNGLARLFTGDKYKYRRYSELKPSAAEDIDYDEVVREALGRRAQQLFGDKKITRENLKEIWNKLSKAEQKKVSDALQSEYERLDYSKVYGEEHSYSRVFSSAIYDALKNEYNSRRAEASDVDPKVSFKGTAEDIRKALYSGLKIAPTSDPTFKDVAIAMINGDKLFNNGAVSDSLIESFKEKGILTDEDIAKNERLLRGIREMDFRAPETLLEPNKLLSLQGNEMKKEFKDLGERFIEEAKRKGILDVDSNFTENLQVTNMYKDKDGRTFITYISPIAELKDGGKLKGSLVLAFDETGKLIYGNVYGTDNLQERIEDTNKSIVDIGS